MTRLMIENLEGRDLMSAVALAGIAPPEPRSAVITELEEFANAAVSLTAPLGSTKGSFTNSQAPPAVPHTYPESWATFPSSFSDDRFVNEMDVMKPGPEVNGIIAILIGLRTATQPAGEATALTVGTQSTKGSLLQAAGLASDGESLDWPWTFASKNEVSVESIDAAREAAIADYLENEPRQNGIIAIHLFSPQQPGSEGAWQGSRSLPYAGLLSEGELTNASILESMPTKSGLLIGLDSLAQPAGDGATRSFLLPYVEQHNA